MNRNLLLHMCSVAPLSTTKVVLEVGDGVNEVMEVVLQDEVG